MYGMYVYMVSGNAMKFCGVGSNICRKFTVMEWRRKKYKNFWKIWHIYLYQLKGTDTVKRISPPITNIYVKGTITRVA